MSLVLLPFLQILRNINPSPFRESLQAGAEDMQSISDEDFLLETTFLLNAAG